MKILFLHENVHDYLSESVFHGLRSLLGKGCVDVPRFDNMYTPLTAEKKNSLRGGGFTLYGLLEDSPEIDLERTRWAKDLTSYDYIVLANINLQWKQFAQLKGSVLSRKFILLDGSDVSAVFPFISFKHRLQKEMISVFIDFGSSHYFKREFIPGSSLWSNAEKYIPPFMVQRILQSRQIYPISFSIPKEKIWRNDTHQRPKLFQKHIVDQDVAEHFQESFFSAVGSNAHVFSSETDYYGDLRDSKYGITTKRAGWDSLRHYELAANGTVLCFRDLKNKPLECAPMGLNDKNCVSYESYDDLMKKIEAITVAEYAYMQGMTYKWIDANTTLSKAEYMLHICESSK